MTTCSSLSTPGTAHQLPLAAAAKSVLAVESSTVSVGLAQDEARKQGFGNVRFVQGDCEKFARGS